MRPLRPSRLIATLGLALALTGCQSLAPLLPADPQPAITGELRQWHQVILTFTGPASSEDAEPNPFYDYRLDVTFAKDGREIVVPGYFAADGNAAETSATAGDQWRVHFVPDAVGEWTYTVSFRTAPQVAVADDPQAGQPLSPDGATGTLTILPTDKFGRDHRYQGTLEYVGEHYARYKGTGEYFIQEGSQSPENFLAYWEFDNTVDHGGSRNDLIDGLHRYEPHIRDWRPGDPTWQDGKGKGIIGALNYLAHEGMNTFYSVFMSVEADGREIYPWTSYDERVRYDISKLAQWEIVLSHMDTLGLQLMVITQEEENETILGKMTPQRKLYYRELIARFSHHHALLWDLSEEMDRWDFYSGEDIKEICRYFKALDPYDHPIQYVQWKAELLEARNMPGYERLLGFDMFDGTGLQQDYDNTSTYTQKWVDLSAEAGHKWLVGVIEINPVRTGVVTDEEDYWHDNMRKHAIWGNLMAGGSGTVFFFGYGRPHSDIDCEDWRTRDHLWNLMRYAHEFFINHLPFTEMRHDDDLTPGTDDFVFAKQGDCYAIYLKEGGSPSLDLTGAPGNFTVRWYNPRFGGDLREGDVTSVTGGGLRNLGSAPQDPDMDWAILVQREGHTASGGVSK